MLPQVTLGCLTLEPGQHLGRGKRTMPVAPEYLYGLMLPLTSLEWTFLCPQSRRETQVTAQEVGFGGQIFWAGKDRDHRPPKMRSVRRENFSSPLPDCACASPLS